jgi:hypothetical protein
MARHHGVEILDLNEQWYGLLGAEHQHAVVIDRILAAIDAGRCRGLRRITRRSHVVRRNQAQRLRSQPRLMVAHRSTKCPGA